MQPSPPRHMSSQTTSGHDVPCAAATHAVVGQQPQHSAGTQSASVVHGSLPTTSVLPAAGSSALGPVALDEAHPTRRATSAIAMPRMARGSHRVDRATTSRDQKPGPP
jgi:hypothetical protein